jgi:hypothetical protein
MKCQVDQMRRHLFFRYSNFFCLRVKEESFFQKKIKIAAVAPLLVEKIKIKFWIKELNTLEQKMQGPD